MFGVWGVKKMIEVLMACALHRAFNLGWDGGHRALNMKCLHDSFAQLPDAS